MLVLLGIAIAVVLLFGFAVFFGPPYLPTKRRQAEAALDMLDLRPGQTVLELGSGDGRVVRAAARRGLLVVGIEINPLLVLVSWMVTRRYRRQVRIVWGNYFSTSWPQADGIFTFMLDRQMHKLDERIEQWRGGKVVRLASVAFRIPGKKQARQRSGVFLYEYKQGTQHGFEDGLPQIRLACRRKLRYHEQYELIERARFCKHTSHTPYCIRGFTCRCNWVWYMGVYGASRLQGK